MTNLKRIVGSFMMVATLSACAAGKGQDSSTGANGQAFAANQLPVLHKIQSYAFQAPYSCGGDYQKSALFLSEFSKNQNSPELLFNGACRSELSFQASTAGDDISMIADLGGVALQSVSATKALNYEGIVGADNSFKSEVPAVAGHTYAVVISKSTIRALYVFHVDSIAPDSSMKITYAVKSYSIQTSQNTVPGFDWEVGNK